MLKEHIVHSSDLSLPPNHPLHDHLFILKHYKASPSEREMIGIPLDNPGAMMLALNHRLFDSPYSMQIEVADEESFRLMWNAFSRKDARAILRGYGLEHLS